MLQVRRLSYTAAFFPLFNLGAQYFAVKQIHFLRMKQTIFPSLSHPFGAASRILSMMEMDDNLVNTFPFVKQN